MPFSGETFSSGRPYLQKLNHRLTAEMQVMVDVLRLDLIHPVVSGNKYFKLKYHLEAARNQGAEGILSFGGAWSNHIVATAYSAAREGLKSIGIIRGEQPNSLSQTLKDALYYGMQLEFVSRQEFKTLRQPGLNESPVRAGYYIVPEGGGGKEGIRGAAEIVSEFSLENYDYLVCAVGTGTTMAGLLAAAGNQQEVVGIPVLKMENETANDYTVLLDAQSHKAAYSLVYNYHFGGYAKQNQQLLDFMNEFYQESGIPTDIVYTSKLFFGCIELLKNNYFKTGSSLCIIHSGGLQGNRSLSTNQLVY